LANAFVVHPRDPGSNLGKDRKYLFIIKRQNIVSSGFAENTNLIGRESTTLQVAGAMQGENLVHGFRHFSSKHT
jgi:hypothetical protein